MKKKKWVIRATTLSGSLDLQNSVSSNNVGWSVNASVHGPHSPDLSEELYSFVGWQAAFPGNGKVFAGNASWELLC